MSPTLPAGRDLALPVAAGLALVAALALAGERGALLPVVLMGGLGVGAALACAARGTAWAVVALLAFAVVGLNINFRVRELGEVGLDWQNGAKLGTWLLLVGIAALRWRDIAPLLRDRAYGLAWAYAALALVSTAWSQVPAYTGANALGLAAYLCLAALAATALGGVLALRVLIWSLTALAGLSLVGAFVNPDLAWQPPSDVETVYRLRGFSGHPNVLGQQAAVLCLLAVAARRSGALGLKGFLFALGIGLVTTLATRSRFALAAFLLGWAFVVLRDHPRGRALALAGAGLLGAALALGTGYLAMMPPPDLDAGFGDLSRTGSSNEILTLTGRTELWAAAARLIAQKPLFGWGFNGTEGLLLDFLPSNFTGSGLNPHNMTVQTLLSLGFVGSLPAFALFAVLVARLVRRPDTLRDQLTLFVLLNGLGEVEVYGTPVLLNLVFYWVLARDAVAGQGRGA